MNLRMVVNKNHPIYPELRTIATKSAGPLDLLQEALAVKDVSSLQLIGAAIALAVFVTLIQGRGWPPIFRTSGEGAIRKLLDH